MIRAIVDTNLLISAFISRGPAYQIIEDAGQKFELALSEDILAEMRSVLHYPQFERYRLTEPDIENFLARMRQLAFVVSGLVEVATFIPDPKDTHLLASCLEAAADYLVTWDEALLNLANYRGTRIVTPRAFLDILNQEPPQPPTG